jgi:hypothetical protein
MALKPLLARCLSLRYCCHISRLQPLFNKSVPNARGLLKRLLQTIKRIYAVFNRAISRRSSCKLWPNSSTENRLVPKLGTADFALYKSMQDWHNHVGDMLAYINDMLHPHGFEDLDVKRYFKPLWKPGTCLTII